MRNSDQMTIGKTHPTLVSEFSVRLSITVTPTKTDKVDSISLLKKRSNNISDNISYFDQFDFSSQFDQ